ncbi:MAG: type II secretion system F family protein [Candidatus Omnitrophica bacterium]|nr:type II secretion system F family protein [Candidatus Omnitrophota bacterium]
MKYIYKARDKQGKLISGTLEGESEQGIVAHLDSMGCSVIELKPQESSFSLGDIFSRFKRVEKRDVNIFARQLATLLRSGTALLPSLEAICEQTTNKKFKVILKNISRYIHSGESFSDALSKYPKVFSELSVNMARVGETGGMLDEVLYRLAKLGTKELELQTRIKSALIYPVVLMAVAFLVVNLLVVGVLPKFIVVFRASGASLPVVTRIILGISWILRRFWFFILAGLIFAFWCFKNYIKTTDGNYRFHRWLLGLPFFGKIYTKIQIARFARTLSTLTSVGIPLLQALTVVEKTVTNVVIRQSIQNIRINLTEGHSLVEPFKASTFFSPMVVQMISTGEKSGKLDQMLEEVALLYEPEVEYTIKNLTVLLEPLMLLVMGAMVAFIALSVLLPIFNLIKVFRG